MVAVAMLCMQGLNLASACISGETAIAWCRAVRESRLAPILAVGCRRHIACIRTLTVCDCMHSSRVIRSAAHTWDTGLEESGATRDAVARVYADRAGWRRFSPHRAAT